MKQDPLKKAFEEVLGEAEGAARDKVIVGMFMVTAIVSVAVALTVAATVAVTFTVRVTLTVTFTVRVTSYTHSYGCGHSYG